MRKEDLIIRILIILLAIYIIGVGFYFNFSNMLVGRISLDIQEQDYSVNQIIDGDFQFIMRHGELLPKDSIFSLIIGDNSSNMTFEELNIQGNLNLPENNSYYYIESCTLSGSGEGYGWVGNRTNNETNETEYGFGEEYLRDEEAILIPLDMFNLSYGEIGTYNLVLKIYYGDAEIFQESAQISLSEQESIGKSESIIQGQAEINLPVKWEKTIILESDSDFSTSIHEQAINITIYNNDTEVETDSYEFNGNGLLIVDDIGKEFTIEYYTDPPMINESMINDYYKRIVVFSNISYSDVESYINISELLYENESSGVSLKYLNGSCLDIDSYEDLDEDDYIDKIIWTTPHLSYQEFEVNLRKIELLNDELYDDRWTVELNLTGEGDFRIELDKSVSEDTDKDLELKYMKCGATEITNYDISDYEILVEDYSCSDITTFKIEFNDEESVEVIFDFGTSITLEESYIIEDDEDQQPAPTIDDDTGLSGGATGERETEIETPQQRQTDAKESGVPNQAKSGQKTQEDRRQVKTSKNLSNMSIGNKLNFTIPIIKNFVQNKVQNLNNYVVENNKITSENKKRIIRFLDILLG